MSDDFDPYLEWLEIPTEQQPPNYYALLGVEDFEEDLEKIEESFGERYSLVRRYQVGEHGADALRILQEMSKAFDCLTSPHHKKKYDRTLRPDDDADEDPVGGESDDESAKKTSKQESKGKKTASDDDDLAKFGDEPMQTNPPQLQPLDSPASTLEMLGPATQNVPTLQPIPQLSPPSQAPATLQPLPQPAQQPVAQPGADAIWYVQTPDGRRLGPATQGQLDDIVTMRRLDPKSVIWRQGWAQPAPATQVFPELLSQTASAPAGGALKPYQGAAVRPETVQSRRTIFFVVVGLGFIAACAAVFLGFAFTLDFILMFMAGGAGVLALLGGLLEFSPLMDSFLATGFRRRMGDEPTRQLFARIGAMCVLVSFGMITIQSVSAISRRMSGASRTLGMPNSLPNLNSGGFINRSGGNTAGGNNTAGATRPANRARPGNRGAPNEVAASGTRPIIQGFSTYQLKEGAEFTIQGRGLGGATKVIFAKAGNPKSRSSALEAKFQVNGDGELQVTAPLGMRFGRNLAWVCEVHSNGGVAVSLPPNVIEANSARPSIPPHSIVRVSAGQSLSMLHNGLVVLEGNNKINTVMFCRVYVLNETPITRSWNANVLIGNTSGVRDASGSNTKVIVGGGVSVFQQPQPFVVN